jgi:hypothetical protein
MNNMTNLLEMQSRFVAQLHRYEASERSWRNRWILLEGIILAIGLLTPLIVAYRKSGLYPTEFWVWWCTLTPPIAAACAIAMRLTGVQEKCSTDRRRVRRVRHLLQQSDVEIPLCKDEQQAEKLLRAWTTDLSKIENDY